MLATLLHIEALIHGIQGPTQTIPITDKEVLMMYRSVPMLQDLGRSIYHIKKPREFNKGLRRAWSIRHNGLAYYVVQDALHSKNK